LKSHLGEEGTEQFTITTKVNGEIVGVQPIHDPFVRNTTTTTTVFSRWDALKMVFTKKPFTATVTVCVDGSPGAQRAIMTLDPESLMRETETMLADAKRSREEMALSGYCNMASAN
jgi:predicted membrane GTPase involved in stress response